MALKISETYRILVVDDEPRNGEALKVKLEAEGFDVFQATGNAGALAALERHLSDMVLFDVLLPGRESKELCAAFKERSGKKFVPVIMLTTLADEVTRVAAYAAGADDYLPSPVNFIELLARIRNLRRLQALTMAEGPPSSDASPKAPAPVSAAAAKQTVAPSGLDAALLEELESLRIEVLSLHASADHLRNENVELQNQLNALREKKQN